MLTITSNKSGDATVKSINANREFPPDRSDRRR
jgi:hypothetical protein